MKYLFFILWPISTGNAFQSFFPWHFIRRNYSRTSPTSRTAVIVSQSSAHFKTAVHSTNIHFITAFNMK